MKADLIITPVMIGAHFTPLMKMEIVIDGKTYSATIPKDEARRMNEDLVIQPVKHEGKIIYKNTH